MIAKSLISDKTNNKETLHFSSDMINSQHSNDKYDVTNLSN